MAGRGQTGRGDGAGRRQLIVLIGLMVVISVLGYNYWIASTTNSNLLIDISRLQSEVTRLQTETRRTEQTVAMCQQKLTEVGKEKDKHMAADKEKDTMLEDTRRELEDMKTQSTQNTETMASLQKNLVSCQTDLNATKTAPVNEGQCDDKLKQLEADCKSEKQELQVKFDNRLAEIQQQKEGQRRETVSPNDEVKQDIKRSGEEQEGQQNREQIQNRAPVQEHQDHQPPENRVQDEQNNRVPAHQEQQQDRVPVQKPINEEEQRMQQPSEDQQQQGKVGRVDKDVAVQSQELVQEPDLNKINKPVETAEFHQEHQQREGKVGRVDREVAAQQQELGQAVGAEVVRQQQREPDQNRNDDQVNRPVDSAEVRPQDGSVQSTASNRESNHGENRRSVWAVGNEVHRRNDRLNAENSNAKRMPRGGRLREGVNKFGQNQELNMQGQPIPFQQPNRRANQLG